MDPVAACGLAGAAAPTVAAIVAVAVVLPACTAVTVVLPRPAASGPVLMPAGGEAVPGAAIALASAIVLDASARVLQSGGPGRAGVPARA